MANNIDNGDGRNKKWWCFRQNNSGGSFTGPAIIVHIQAYNYKQANDIAEANGLYFNGCDSGADCECCGDRWYPEYGEGTPDPQEYGEIVGPMTTKRASSCSDVGNLDRLFITLP